MVAERYVLVTNLTLSMGPEEFLTRQDDFAAALSSAMEGVCASQPAEDTKGQAEGVGKGGGGAGHACKASLPGDVEIVTFSAGSVIVSFRVWVRQPLGPPTPVVSSPLTLAPNPNPSLNPALTPAPSPSPTLNPTPTLPLTLTRFDASFSTGCPQLLSAWARTASPVPRARLHPRRPL